jgi:DNA-binding transcriptional ArsR family regulator
VISTSALAEVAALLGDTARANMVLALIDGRALTARELSDCAGVSAPTGSSHLAKLVAAGLLLVERQGRHRYHRLASSDVAHMVEAMLNVAQAGRETVWRRPVRVGPGDVALRNARTCYDHLAGRLAVDLAERLDAQGLVRFAGDSATLSGDGSRFLAEFGVDLTNARSGRRPLCRPCLDWSERRPHLAGAVGAALMRRVFELGWARRLEDTRAIAITVAGETGFRAVFGLEVSRHWHAHPQAAGRP